MHPSNLEKFNLIKSYGLPLPEYAITGSGPMGARDLKVIGDIDIIVKDSLWNELEKKYGITKTTETIKIVFPDNIIEAFCQNSFIGWERLDTDPSVSERIREADIIDDLPFEELKHVLYFKNRMCREKDLQDINIINNYLKSE